MSLHDQFNFRQSTTKPRDIRVMNYRDLIHSFIYFASSLFQGVDLEQISKESMRYFTTT